MAGPSTAVLPTTLHLHPVLAGKSIVSSVDDMKHVLAANRRLASGGARTDEKFTGTLGVKECPVALVDEAVGALRGVVRPQAALPTRVDAVRLLTSLGPGRKVAVGRSLRREVLALLKLMTMGDATHIQAPRPRSADVF